MKKSIITVSRQFGSGGRYIGKCVAEKLGFEFYDKEIIERIADESGLSKEYIERFGEYAPHKSIFAYSFVGRGANGMSIDDYIQNIQSQVIKEIAEKKNCVIVGRCADYILRNYEECVNVFILGEEKAKAKRIEELYNVSEKEAIKLMKDTDKLRSINYNYCTSRKWGDISNYTICLNSSTIGLEKCADIICSL